MGTNAGRGPAPRVHCTRELAPVPNRGLDINLCACITAARLCKVRTRACVCTGTRMGRDTNKLSPVPFVLYVFPRNHPPQIALR
jgi:hypothetical protein